MKDFSIRKLKRGLDTNDARIINDRVFSWFLLFIFGLVCGCVVFGRIDTEALTFIDGASRACVDAAFFVLLLLFSTSYLGSIFIPLTVFARALLLAACVSASYSLAEGGGILMAVYAAALPTLIVLPSFFIAADDCARLSGQLFELRFSCSRSGGKIPVCRHLLLVLLFLIIDFIYCIYIMPLLVS